MAPETSANLPSFAAGKKTICKRAQRAFSPWVLVLTFYRGRLVGFVQRHDDRNAVRLLSECDRLEEEWNLSKLTQ